MRNEVLGALDDPREIADTQLVPVAQSERDRQPRRVAQRLEADGGAARCAVVKPSLAKRLGKGQVEAEKFTLVGSGHIDILTIIGSRTRSLRLSPKACAFC